MDEKTHEYIENLGWVLMWVGAWSLIDMFVDKYLNTHKVKSYLLLYIIGSLMMFYI